MRLSGSYGISRMLLVIMVFGGFSVVHAADAAVLLPNEYVGAPGIPDQNNASMAYHEVIPKEAYAVWTEHFAPFGQPPTQVWNGWTPVAGSGIPWAAAGALFGPIPSLTLPESWNPSMAAVPPITADAYYMTMVEWPAPALVLGIPSIIVANTSVGSGAPFPSGTGPAVVFQGIPGTNWLDYPYLVVDDVLGNAGPPGFGDVHIAWVEYIEGGDGDADGNGNWFDDPADSFVIWAASANTGAGPSPYPGFIIQVVHPRPAVAPRAHQTHRPSLSVVGPSGTRPPIALPASAVYLAYVDFVSSSVIIDASPAPGLGAPWGVFGPFSVAPVALLPAYLNGGIKAASTVSIAVDNGPIATGNVYIAFADYTLGDADILFSVSGNGGATWSLPMRINQDSPTNGLDQWAPHMMVDVVTGDIVVTYYDRRMDSAVNLLVETWASTSTDGGLTWTDAVVSDAGPTPPVSTLVVGPGIYTGDYLTSDFNPASGWGAVWNDGRNGGDQDVLFDNVRQPSGVDSDGDGVPDASDNCPQVFNPNQAITVAVTGDVNADVLLTSADIIYMVNHVFKGGPAPIPCPAAGDVNCDGQLTSADIIYLVNHVFKGGPAPCNVCTFAGLGWTCP